jgi:hypothetical protein
VGASIKGRPLRVDESEMQRDAGSMLGRSARLIVGLPVSFLLLFSVGLLLRRSAAAGARIEPALGFVIGLVCVAALFVLFGLGLLVRRPAVTDSELVWGWLGIGVLVGFSLFLSAVAAYITILLGPLNPLL